MYELFTLSNGVRVIAESIRHFRSVSVGLWVGAGSMYETPRENGLSHFLEHMLFKGTQRRTARQIAEEMDGIGGQINAFTSKECTCYYAKVIDEHLPTALDVLSDLLRCATLDEGEMEKERGVILEEIAMVEDTPEDLVHELLCDAALAGNPLAQPILGVNEGIRSYRRENLARFRATHYRPDNTVLAVAGRYDSAALRELAERYLGSWQPAEAPDMPAWERCFTPGLRRRNKDIEQVHLCVGFPGVALIFIRFPCLTTCSAAACPRACFSVSARKAAWPTPSTAIRRPIRAAGCIRSMQAPPRSMRPASWRCCAKKWSACCGTAWKRRNSARRVNSSRAGLSWARKARPAI